MSVVRIASPPWGGGHLFELDRAAPRFQIAGVSRTA
ncbi:hypothetical protein BDB13_1813 [Rhodococcus sp. OK302]|nr:hypothetical protein BDB13_1813 [Rhodococcus sp. OK302]